MPEVDTSLNIVGIIAIVALLSPPITSIIENLFKLIAKHIDYKRIFYENEYNHKRELFEKFLNASGQAMYDKDSSIEKLSDAYYSLIPYIPQKELIHFREYCNLIQDGDLESNYEKASLLLNDKIVPCIKKELRRRKPLRK